MNDIRRIPFVRVFGILAYPEALNVGFKETNRAHNAGYAFPTYTVDLIRLHDVGEELGSEDRFLVNAVREGLRSVWHAPFAEEEREDLVRMFDEHVSSIDCCGSHLGQTLITSRHRDKIDFLPKPERKLLKTLVKTIKNARMPFFDTEVRDGRTCARLYPDPLYRAVLVNGRRLPSTGKFMRLVAQGVMPEAVDIKRQPITLDQVQHGDQAYAAVTYAAYQGRGEYRKEYGVNADLHFLMLKKQIGPVGDETAVTDADKPAANDADQPQANQLQAEAA